MPWIDEYKKYDNTSHFQYDSASGIHSINNTLAFQYYYVLTFRNNEVIKINSDKNYLFTHEINKIGTTNTNLRLTHFLEDDSIIYVPYSQKDPIIFEDLTLTTRHNIGNFYTTCYDSLYNKEVNNSCSYWFNESNSDVNKNYIKSIRIREIDFFISGYNPHTNGTLGRGWRYFDTEVQNMLGSYLYEQSGLSNPIIYKGGFEENFIATKILYDNFGYSFDYFLSSTTPSLNIKGYLIDSFEFEKWRSGTGTFSFNSSDEIEKISISSNGNGNISDEGLNGTNKYFVIKLPNQMNSGDTFRIGNIKITGGYSNSIYNNGLTSSYDNLSDIGSPTYSNGTNVETSYIGNGQFLSGIWEDGVWNNGIRTDNSLEFVDILNAYPVNENKWRIEIKKSSLITNTERDLINRFRFVSIGNIVAIDINGERKLLKNSYLVIDVVENYIVVETDFLFPIRRIERDSNKHRIKVSGNIWLSGTFLNGRFEGIWNNGLFKGNPYNTVMENTQWIDGTFDGGRFISTTPNVGTFSITTTNEINNITYPKLSITANIFNKLNINDEVYISNSTYYNGNSFIIGLDSSSNTITIDKQYLGTASGVITHLMSNGLIQRFNFIDNNLSKLTSNDSVSPTSLFKYNSWIDVNYDDSTSVNIGKDIKTIDPLNNKTVSQNNLYGYPSYDILSSVSKFRNSNNLNSTLYNLGTKYKIYTDYIGRSSSFDDPFDSNSLDNFYRNGWTFSNSGINSGSTSSIVFNRTNPSLITEGKELEIKSANKGGVLDNTIIDIEKRRYSIVEFNHIETGTFSVDNIIVDSIVGSRSYPILNLSNINYDNYLPINKNINHLTTPNRRKIEYFFNKTQLNMSVMGYGDLDKTKEFRLVIDDLKFYEVDMIPFFKYFNTNNIYRGIQTPLEGKSPFIDYVLNKYPFVESSFIPFESFEIKPKL